MKRLISLLKNNKKSGTMILTAGLIFSIVAVSVTMAVYIGRTVVLANSFETVDLTTHIEERIDGNPSAISLKQPIIVNDGEATAFIRARVTVSPEIWGSGEDEIDLQLGRWSLLEDQDGTIGENPLVVTDKGDFTQYMSLGKNDGTKYQSKAGDDVFGWIYCEEDGFYYYNKPIVVKGYTKPLFDAVVIGSKVIDNFDITIYQEAVSSKKSTIETDGTASVATMQKAFNAVNK